MPDDQSPSKLQLTANGQEMEIPLDEGGRIEISAALFLYDKQTKLTDVRRYTIIANQRGVHTR